MYIMFTTIYLVKFKKLKGDHIMWTTPIATEMRFGFEVTMYVCNRQFLMKFEVINNTEITDWFFHSWQCNCPLCSTKS